MTDAERLRGIVWRSPWERLREPLEATAGDFEGRVFLVGGHVRDLLLERTPSDFDLTIEGDGLAFAGRLAAVLGCGLRVSDRFLTAEIDLPGGLRLDITTARSETYEHPGALPIVSPASMRSDLERRDFSVNTFALELLPAARPELLSVEGARADLDARVLRTLHGRSFSDDPTRILRAVRQELQLDFRLTAADEEAARGVIRDGVLSGVSGERLWRELEPLVSNAAFASPGLRRLEALGVLTGLMPGLGWSAAQERRFSRSLSELERAHGAPQAANRAVCLCRVALLALADGPTGYLGEDLAERLHLAQRDGAILRDWPARAASARQAVDSDPTRPSRVHASLGSLSLGELISLAGSVEGAARDWVRREMSSFRDLELTLRAADLLAHGHSPGPPIGAALASTLAARLDGEIGREDELDYALGVLARYPSPELSES